MKKNEKLVEKMKGKLEKAFNDNVQPEETVDVKLQVHRGEGIAVTDKRVMIIKAGMVSAAGMFGANCKSFYYNQITSVDLRLGVMGGHIQLTVPGSTDIKGKGILDMGQSENAATFTSNYKERMKHVANLIRERVQSSQSSNPVTNDTKGSNMVDQITKLAELRQQNLITEEEFLTAKNKLLS